MYEATSRRPSNKKKKSAGLQSMVCALCEQPQVELPLMTRVKGRGYNNIAASIEGEFSKDTPTVGIRDGGCFLLGSMHPIFSILLNLFVWRIMGKGREKKGKEITKKKERNTNGKTRGSGSEEEEEEEEEEAYCH